MKSWVLIIFNLDSNQKYEIDVAPLSGESYSLQFDALVDEQQSAW